MGTFNSINYTLKPFYERHKKGMKAEERFGLYLYDNDINFNHNKVGYNGIDSVFNKKYGDFLLKNKRNENIYVDIKSSFLICEDSIYGMIKSNSFYIILDESLGDVENGWVINWLTVYTYYNRMLLDNSNKIVKIIDPDTGHLKNFIRINKTLRKRISVKSWIENDYGIIF